MCRTIVSLLALMVSTGLASHLFAAGKGAKGLGEAVSNAGGNGAAARGLNKAGQNLTRVPPGLGHANGMGHGKGPSLGGNGKPVADGTGTVPADAAALPSDPANHQKQLVIEQRNRDHRLIQAQKLRELAAKNGDAELAANADRMEAFAQQHYQDRVDHLGRFGVTDPNAVPASTAPPASTDPASMQPTTTTTTVDQPAATTAAAPWWRPKWLFGATK